MEQKKNTTFIEKETEERETLTLFSITVELTPGAESGIHVSTNVKGHRAEMMAFLEALDVNPAEYRDIMTHAAKATVQDFVQQIVNHSDSLTGAEIEDSED